MLLKTLPMNTWDDEEDETVEETEEDEKTPPPVFTRRQIRERGVNLFSTGKYSSRAAADEAALKELRRQAMRDQHFKRE